ncbi:MAG: FmdB family zinc ribbon protein [Chloroflexota bacterium]|jgi:putative FmdB family regulatory protein|nr:zinc ribbon domain-containing protein [Dehalococcoidia bacterium]MDW8046788.1 FmdB family zinc ribbon protein [Chloroflexota bacterium]
MPIYEFYCPTCRERFEERRPMHAMAAEARCRQGHLAERVLSAFAVASGTREGEAGGGCCAGGACGCAAR